MASVSSMFLYRTKNKTPADFHQPALAASSRLELHLAAEAETQFRTLTPKI
jgi:glucan biosynthesis protein